MTTARTLCDIFFQSVETYRKPDHLRVKRDGAWRDVGSDEYRQAVEEISMGLRGLGIAPGDRVAILSENRPEWAFADLATLAAGAVDVPIYTTLSAAQILHLLNDSGSRAIFVSSPALVETVSSIRGQALSLAHVIAIDPVTAPNVLALDELRARRPGRFGRGPAGGAAAGRPRQAGGRRHHHLYVGHDRRSQGRHAHARQPRVERGRLRQHRARSGASRELPLLPAPLPHLRAPGRPLPHAEARRHHRLRGERREGAREPARDPPSALLSVPRLYEKIFARIQEKVAADSAISRGIFNWALGVGRRRCPTAWRAALPAASSACR
jgi:long-chain acyl-CoA synthetase